MKENQMTCDKQNKKHADDKCASTKENVRKCCLRHSSAPLSQLQLHTSWLSLWTNNAGFPEIFKCFHLYSLWINHSSGSEVWACIRVAPRMDEGRFWSFLQLDSWNKQKALQMIFPWEAHMRQMMRCRMQEKTCGIKNVLAFTQHSVFLMLTSQLKAQRICVAWMSHPCGLPTVHMSLNGCCLWQNISCILDTWNE